MVDTKPDAPPRSERERRLAAALRDNLRRRKAAARAASADAPDEGDRVPPDPEPREA